MGEYFPWFDLIKQHDIPLSLSDICYIGNEDSWIDSNSSRLNFLYKWNIPGPKGRGIFCGCNIEGNKIVSPFSNFFSVKNLLYKITLTLKFFIND